MRANGRRRRRALLIAALVCAGCRGHARPDADTPVPGTKLLEVGGARIEVRMPDGPMVLEHDEIVHWIEDSARAVTTYYGRFPVRRLTIELTRTGARGVDDGTTRGLEDSALIRVGVGAHTEVADLEQDWVMTHEMVHTALPDLPRPHHWLEEGLATYVEPIARAQAGLESDEEVWGQLVRGLPQGLPERDDRGLDRTPTWGRTYWGGALFCLLADVEIRVRTQNRAGLQDALRAVVAREQTILVESPVDRLLAIGDEAVGVQALSELYARHATHAVDVDLAALWMSLGVSMRGGRVRFDDAAPHAEVRRAITRVNARAAR